MNKKGIIFTVNRSEDNQFYITISSHNNRILFTSETYTRKSNAKKVIFTITESIWPDREFKIIDNL